MKMKKICGEYSVDVDEVPEQFEKIPVSVPCWQGDDIIGFEESGAGTNGGLIVTGNYTARP